METQDNDNRNQDRNTIPNDRPAASNDEREKANNGDWEDQRDETGKDKEGYDADQNDNTGGAGSTGSAATNS